MREHDRFVDDDRAIEGLPIRLVIALVIGVASLGIMMNMLGGIDGLSTTEVTVEYDDAVVDDDGSVTIDVVTEEGEPVEGSTVIVTSGTAQIDTISEETGDDDNSVTIDFGPGATADGDVSFATNQDLGTLEIEVIPPSDGDYEDGRENPEVRVKKT